MEEVKFRRRKLMILNVKQIKNNGIRLIYYIEEYTSKNKVELSTF
jgi:hypothetical protein